MLYKKYRAMLKKGHEGGQLTDMLERLEDKGNVIIDVIPYTHPTLSPSEHWFLIKYCKGIYTEDELKMRGLQ
jgi:hypothetical protein